MKPTDPSGGRGRRPAWVLIAVPPVVVAALAAAIMTGTDGGAGTADGSSNCAGPLGEVQLASGARPGTAQAGLGSIGNYQGQQLENAVAIIRAGQGLGLDAQGVSIGVMTAMGESSLINLDRGDVVGPDSRGLFQQRANGAWGSLADRMDPTTAATNFFRGLLTVLDWRSLPPTLAAHAVQRNADPYHYERYWPAAVQVVSRITGTAGWAGRVGGADAPCQQPDVDPAALIGTDVGSRAYAAAMTQVGTPYSWGGGGPQGPSLGFGRGARTLGFDCSSLVQYAYAQAAGRVLPRTAAAQRAALPAIALTQLQPGDLLFFRGASHVAISDGQGGFVHAPRTGRTVEHVSGWQSNSYWRDGVEGAARPRQ